MARCFQLEAYSVKAANGRLFVTLEAWAPEALERFARIVIATFPEGQFRRTTARPTKFLGLQPALRLVGIRRTRGKARVEALLELVSRSLTIEDLLDESHALGYHQDEDDTTGKLKRSSLGDLVVRAKYDNNKADREMIGEALAEFLRAHPRYARADVIACMPGHAVGSKPSLPSRLLGQLSAALSLATVGIVRTSTRREQKEITDPDRAAGVKKRITNQRGSMRVDRDLARQSAIVVDDLYGSGASMQEAGRALRAAGAREVLGVCVTKQRLYEGVSLTTQD